MITKWWIEFVESVISLWRKGITLMRPLEERDFRLTKDSRIIIKVTAYKNFDVYEQGNKSEISVWGATNAVRSLYIAIVCMGLEDELHNLIRYMDGYREDGLTMESLCAIYKLDITRLCI